MKNCTKQWIDIKLKLDDAAITTNIELLNFFMQWFEKTWFNQPQSISYMEDVKRLLLYNPQNYPINCTCDPVEDTIRRIMNLNFTKCSELTMVVYNLLWDMLAYKSEESCPRCIFPALRYLEVSESGEPVMECEQCGIILRLNAKEFIVNSETFFPASITTLKKYNLCNRKCC